MPRRFYRPALIPPSSNSKNLNQQEPTTGFAPASSGVQSRRLSISSHVGKHSVAQAASLCLFTSWQLVLRKAGAQGFEPCAAVLEAACSPRSTLLSVRVSEGSRTLTFCFTGRRAYHVHHGHHGENDEILRHLPSSGSGGRTRRSRLMRPEWALAHPQYVASRQLLLNATALRSTDI